MILKELQPSVTVAFQSSLPPSPLWAVVSDPLAQVQFSNELQSIRIVGDVPVELGTRFVGEQRKGDHRWLSYSEVTEFEVNRSFAWNVRLTDDDSTPVATWALSLTTLHSGTRLEESVILHGGDSPMTQQVTDHPETLLAVVETTLSVFAGNMLRTLQGIDQIASSI